MITVTQLVEELLTQDDVALAAAKRGVLNLSQYARSIQPAICERLLKDVGEGSIVTALSRLTLSLSYDPVNLSGIVQSLVVHSNLEGITYERSANVSAKIRELYNQTNVKNSAFLTVTQGLNEITIVAEASTAQQFRAHLGNSRKVYDKTNLVGITAKLKLGYLETPNLIFGLTRRLAYKNINIIEVVSTATELTFIIERRDLGTSLEQLQKDI